MNKPYYTNVSVSGNDILLRGVDSVNGKRFSEVRDYRPTLWVPSKRIESTHTTVDGKSVESFSPGSIRDCKEFIQQYKDVKGFEIFGNTQYQYQFAYDYTRSHWEGDIGWSAPQVSVATIDIETTCDNGFPQTDNPTEEIIVITIFRDGKYYCWARGDISAPEADAPLELFTFKTELDLLRSFLDHWSSDYPDILTGWNTRFFDIPYLHNRIARVLGAKQVKRLSPWKQIKEKQIIIKKQEATCYELVGISSLDYYELYKQYTFTNQESYKLDHIAYVELGERKMSYEEYGNISQFAKENFKKFVEYNIKDVSLVRRLDEKLKLIELQLSIAYLARCNYEDVFSQVRTWDCIIHSFLMDTKRVVPQKKDTQKDFQYAGAYVKDPILGRHDWVVSLDLNSLYPHLIMQYNISPDTIIDKATAQRKFKIAPFTVDDILAKSVDTSELTLYDMSMTANGEFFARDKQGFLPSLMESMYNDRKQSKNKMIALQKAKQSITDAKEQRECDNKIAYYSTKQMALKIALNSAYGALGNQYFRFFDIRQAEGITLSGQVAIRWIEKHLNEYLNDLLKTTGFDYVVASDTDSVYLRMGELVKRVFPNGADSNKIVNFLSKCVSEKIEPFIVSKYAELAKYMNAYQDKMVMKCEVIADKGIWTAKKRYILNVHDSEGVRYATPVLKIMGIETTRSSTPKVVRESLKKAINLILTTDQETVWEFIEEFKAEFSLMPPDAIAFPRGVKGLEKYIDDVSVYKKSTPIAVKGSLVWNNLLKQRNLTRKYRQIVNYDKVKFVYLLEPNPLGDTSIAFPDYLPKELDLNRFVDYNVQFDKAFIEPLKTILETIGWSHERRVTLESLFL